MLKNIFANPKTSIAGVLFLGLAACEVFNWLPGGTTSAIVNALAGLGFLSAADQKALSDLQGK